MAYTAADYKSVLDEVWDDINALQHIKGGEYAKDIDRLANFREAAYHSD